MLGGEPGVARMQWDIQFGCPVIRNARCRLDRSLASLSEAHDTRESAVWSVDGLARVIDTSSTHLPAGHSDGEVVSPTHRESARLIRKVRAYSTNAAVEPLLRSHTTELASCGARKPVSNFARQLAA